VLVIYSDDEWSAKLRSEWPRDLQVPTEWRKNTQEITNRYQILGTPTLLALDWKHQEVKRQLGYLPAEQIKQWLAK
jgi:thioredoxin-related protein